MSKLLPVPPLSYKKIGEIGRRNHVNFFPNNQLKPSRINILDFLEFELETKTGFRFRVEDYHNLKEGETNFLTKELFLANTTYEQLCQDAPRARFTACHELGHVIVHAGYIVGKLENQSPAITLDRSDIPVFMDPDWQAEVFASTILAPSHLLRKVLKENPIEQVEAVIRIFGMSYKAAMKRIQIESKLN